MIDKQLLESRLKPTGQEHLLAFWNELSTTAQRELAAQIEALDLELLASLYRGDVDQPNWAEIARRATPPPAVRLSQRASDFGGNVGITETEATHRGVQALRAGKVAVLITAGGQGTRLGFELPKSMYPIGPLSSASLLRIHVEKVRAIAARYDVHVPLYLMTSPATHDETLRFLKENGNFGLPDARLVVFCQGTMPAVDIGTGKVLLAEKGKLFLSPDGHGGMVAALGKSGAIEHMKSHGIEQLFYLQVDNPLVPICDPVLIGYHLQAHSEMTSLAIAKQEPHDQLGSFALMDDRLHVIEYSDLPSDVAERRDSHGKLKFWAGSIAVHVIERSLIERTLEREEALPFHIARKKVPHIDAKGRRVNPLLPNALKFEKFIFDLLPEAQRPLVVEYHEEDCFAPLKNAPGAEKYTPEYVQRMLLDQHHRWLTAAGATIADGAKIEISPLFALDATDVATRLELDRYFAKSQYLDIDLS